jgi:hypothetical protein
VSASLIKELINENRISEKFENWLIAFGICLAALIPFILWMFLGIEQEILAVSLFLVPIIAFFGFIALGKHIQLAITASIILAYFVLLAIATFVPFPEDLFPLQDQLISSFTTSVSVVIAFYFGSEAYKWHTTFARIQQLNTLNTKLDTKYCPKCGESNSLEAKFCSNCGEKQP